MPWLPRAGLAVAIETPSSQNLYTRSLYLSGGFTPLSMVLTDDDASAASVQQAMETNNPGRWRPYAMHAQTQNVAYVVSLSVCWDVAVMCSWVRVGFMQI